MHFAGLPKTRKTLIYKMYTECKPHVNQKNGGIKRKISKEKMAQTLDNFPAPPCNPGIPR
jgi:hypothetical protein